MFFFFCFLFLYNSEEELVVHVSVRFFFCFLPFAMRTENFHVHPFLCSFFLKFLQLPRTATVRCSEIKNYIYIKKKISFYFRLFETPPPRCSHLPDLRGTLTLVKLMDWTRDYSSQQHPDLDDSIGRPCSIFTLLAGSLAPLEGGPTLSLISAAMVINACSTFIAFFADVSKNGMPS